MRVFVTGASGWIGSAVVAELLETDHDVVGLARSEESAATLAASGVEVRRGSLDDLELLADTAATSDGVIHLAFKHEQAFSGDFEGAAAADRLAVEAIGDALAGSDRPFVIASGLLGLAPGRVVTERDGHDGDPSGGHGPGPAMRLATAEYTLSLAERGVRSSVLRLPPTNHGKGDGGFIPALIGFARAAGSAGYLGDGSSRWPAVHRLDSARLFRLALEAAPAGSTLHAVADEGVSMREVAQVIGDQLQLPVAPVPPEQAGARFGFLAGFVGLDSPASSAITQGLLGWTPTQPGLIEDLGAGHYFQSPSRNGG